MTKCENCKHWNCDTGFCSMKMIITSRKEVCDYWCSMKNEYLNFTDFKKNCTEFEKDNLSLTEKENKVW